MENNNQKYKILICSIRPEYIDSASAKLSEILNEPLESVINKLMSCPSILAHGKEHDVCELVAECLTTYDAKTVISIDKGPQKKTDYVYSDISTAYVRNHQTNMLKPKSSIHCPNCGSTNVKKISTTKRLFSAGLFGLASSSIGKQFQCMEKNCGYKW